MWTLRWARAASSGSWVTITTVEPPAYLMELAPRIFEEERQRIAARFDEAVRLAEQAFIAELSRLVNHLVERLSGGGNGEPSENDRGGALRSGRSG